MFTFSYFVSEEYLKSKNSPLPKNLDPDVIYTYVRTAQDNYMEDVLGSTFYYSLMNKVYTNSTTSDEDTLLQLIKPCLTWYSVYDAIPHIDTKMDNKGLLEANGNFLQNTEFSKMKYLRADAENKAGVYLSKIQRYLCQNGHLFVEYQNIGTGTIPNEDVRFTDIDIAFDCYDPLYIDYKFFKKYFG